MRQPISTGHKPLGLSEDINKPLSKDTQIWEDIDPLHTDCCEGFCEWSDLLMILHV